MVEIFIILLEGNLTHTCRAVLRTHNSILFDILVPSQLRNHLLRLFIWRPSRPRHDTTSGTPSADGSSRTQWPTLINHSGPAAGVSSPAAYVLIYHRLTL